MESIIRKTVKDLEKRGVNEMEVYLGVSALGKKENDLLESLGWRAIYAEVGVFLLIRK